MTKPTITEALALPCLPEATKRSLEFHIAQRKQATSPLAKKVIDQMLTRLCHRAVNESQHYASKQSAQG